MPSLPLQSQPTPLTLHAFAHDHCMNLKLAGAHARARRVQRFASGMVYLWGAVDEISRRALPPTCGSQTRVRGKPPVLTFLALDCRGRGQVISWSHIEGNPLRLYREMMPSLATSLLFFHDLSGSTPSDPVALDVCVGSRNISSQPPSQRPRASCAHNRMH
jgi:hypothetical protein